MINARAQNAYGVAHFAQQNHVPQVRWENVDIIGDFIKNQMAKKQLEMMDKNYELAKDQAAFAREKFDEDVRQFNVGRNTLSAKEQADLDFKNREWNEMTPYQKAQLEVEKAKVNAMGTNNKFNVGDAIAVMTAVKQGILPKEVGQQLLGGGFNLNFSNETPMSDNINNSGKTINSNGSGKGLYQG